MNDFASYSKGKGETDRKETDWNKEAEAVVNAYRGKSEADLLRAIYARAVEGKRNGTLTNEQIDEFYRRFSPMLDAAKRKRLKKLVEELKRM